MVLQPSGRIMAALGEQPAVHGFMIWQQESTKKTSNKNKKGPPPQKKKKTYRCRIRIIACSYNIPVPHLLVATKNPPETKSRGLDTFGSARAVAFHFSAAARKPIRGKPTRRCWLRNGRNGREVDGTSCFFFVFLPAKCSDDFCLHHLA